MEQNNRMMGQRFTDHNQNFDKGQYLKIYMWFIKAKLCIHTGTKNQGCIDDGTLIEEYKGSLPWY